MMILKKILFSIVCLTIANKVTIAQMATVTSPDMKLKVVVDVPDSIPMYSVVYNGKTMLENSPLGLITNEGVYNTGIRFVNKEEGKIDKHYQQEKIKKSDIHYQANKLTCTFENARKQQISVVFQVSNNDIAFRYELPVWKERMSCVVEKEATGFKFPAQTTTFLSGMMSPMTGFARTAPSYESGYEADGPLGKATRNGEGYVFPGLFRIGTDGWVLVSETGVSSLYCGAHLSDGNKDGLYTVAYPSQKQNNGFGSTGAAISLPGVTPWRTITVGSSLKPIVET